MKLILFILIPISIFSPTAYSSLQDINSKFPLEIEDAHPVDEGTWDVHALSEFKQDSGREGQWKLIPELRTGLAKRFQALVRSQFLPGPLNDQTGSGDIETEIHYLLIDSREVPSVGISVTGMAPTGEGSRGIDSETKLILSQNLGSEEHLLHLNVARSYNAKPREDEQREFFLSSIGISSLLSDRFLLLLDFVHNQQKDSVRHENYGEAGFRYQIARRFIGGFGASYGEDLFLTRLGLEYDF